MSGESADSVDHQLDAYDFDLPASAIAQEAVEPRDAARLLVATRHVGLRAHATVRELGAFLPSGALLVFNDSMVVPARLLGVKADSGGAVELLLTEPFAGPWRAKRDASGAADPSGLHDQPALARSSKGLKVGQRVELQGGGSAVVRAVEGQGLVRVDLDGAADLDALLARCGRLPLPPYLRQGREDDAGSDRERYQTAWARAKGSVAAPTAGLHFTAPLLQGLRDAGFGLATLTLHVGPGTFLPVRSADLRTHQVLAERYEVSPEAAAAIAAARRDGRPIIAVGTTATRVLESFGDAAIAPGRGWTALTVRPGHHFGVVQGLMTNFHLPRSSLLVLLGTFAGRGPVLDVYRQAVGAGYRFYSYGDASLWL